MKTALIALLIALLVPFTGTMYLYEQFFGPRIDAPPPRPIDRRIEDHPGLIREPVEFQSNKNQTLRGFIYKNQNVENNPPALIIIAHGLGGNHEGYMEEIAAFAREGFWILGYDNTGTYSSDGKGLLGLPQATLDLRAALEFVEGNQLLKGLSRIIYGHSWGGYASCAVLNYDVYVDGVVSVAGFNRGHDMILEVGRNNFGNWVTLLSPYIRSYEFLKFGETANLTAVDGINGSETQVLLLHGDCDDSISIERSIYTHFVEAPQPRVTARLVISGTHDLMTAPEAIEYIRSLNRELGEMQKQYENNEIPPSVLEAFDLTVDKKLLRRLNEDLFKEVIDFCWQVALGG